jgi:hypothetical protein
LLYVEDSRGAARRSSLQDKPVGRAANSSRSLCTAVDARNLRHGPVRAPQELEFAEFANDGIAAPLPTLDGRLEARRLPPALVLDPVRALALAALILQQAAFTGWDLAYWGTVAALVPARDLDITRFRGRTAEGTPASPVDFQRFALYLAIAAGGVWVSAHAAGRRVLRG